MTRLTLVGCQQISDPILDSELGKETHRLHMLAGCTTKVCAVRVAQEISRGNWSPVLTEDIKRWDSAPEKNEVERIHKINGMVRSLANEIVGLCKEVEIATTYDECRLRQGRINAYTVALSGLVERM